MDAFKTPLKSMSSALFAVALLGGCYACRAGDRVWLDENQNGLQDPGEPGVEGVLVEMLNWPTYGQGYIVSDYPEDRTVLWSDVTDANGRYHLWFPGTGRLYFHLPAGYQFTLPFEGDNSHADSDVRDPSGIVPVIWRVTFFTDFDPWHSNADKDLFGMDNVTNHDAGLIPLPTPTPEILIPLPPDLSLPGAAGTPTVSVSVDTFCRSGPGSEFKALTTITVGEVVEVIAVYPGSEYVVVKRPGDSYDCWLWLRYADKTDFSGTELPEATLPPPPTPTFTPRPPRRPTATPTFTIN